MSPAAAAAPLDDENLLAEILLRLPPLPSTLLRASLVCKRWRLLVSDVRFFRRFREHHRHSPPLLGCFVEGDRCVSYTPTMDPPDRVPAERLSLQLDETCHSWVLGSRHGLVLISPNSRNHVLVWDPATGEQHRIAFPPGFVGVANSIHGAVLRAAGEAGHFQVILVGVGGQDKQHMRLLARVYSSEKGVWGALISPLIPFEGYTTRGIFAIYFRGFSALMLGNSFYWCLGGRSDAILEFDLERQTLDVIRIPPCLSEVDLLQFAVMRAEGGGLGLLSILGFTAQLWKRKTDCNGVASWGMATTIELDKLLSLNPEKERVQPLIERACRVQ
ncbi:hypothetical protein CFC21_091283 [Triticum aestivum]|uniref:F-box domain-containing protein n=2 Tax=Triticum aestivum TaxID=4565 RepID=A0A9R1LFY0_WHEAT|nr:uncharacterized protein LOC123143312 [Triticum aestivum]XP_044418118.1 uncharacterized protein LOC123143312 [Triticum aestivum]XP_044418119.1 uncharacterized protein LOC123143312 [Triticum aestivum]KAF7088141.1 hypothetical protein CFC21_091283 [Triticum aestivum]